MQKEILVFRASDADLVRSIWGYDPENGNAFEITQNSTGSVRETIYGVTDTREGIVYAGKMGDQAGALVVSNGSDEFVLTMDSQGVPFSNPEGFAEFKGEALFIAKSALVDDGLAMFITNGSDAPVRLSDFAVKKDASSGNFFIVNGDHAYYKQGTAMGGGYRGDLAVTDGTMQGTGQIGDIPIQLAFPYRDGIVYVDFGNDLYFTDGTLGGIEQIPLVEDTGGRSRSGFVGGEDRFYFSSFIDADFERGVSQIFVWDGSDEELSQVKTPFDTNFNFSRNQFFQVATEDRLYFVADDRGTSGFELWTYNGNEAVKLTGADVANDTGNLSFSSAANAKLGAVNGNLFFTAFHDGKENIYFTDGTVENTRKVSELSGNIENLVTSKTTGDLYFTVGDTLWRTDGMETEELVDVSPGRNTGVPTFLQVVTMDSDSLPSGPSVIDGTNDPDVFNALAGDTLIDGAGGQDTVIYQGGRVEFSLTIQISGTIIVDKPDGSDTLISIERIQFDDGALLFDLDSASLGFTYRIYAAAYDRTPDQGGLRYWVETMDWLGANDPGAHKEAFLAHQFLSAPEFVQLYGANPSDFDYINAMYLNVLGREADQEGFNFWVEQMGAGLSRAGVLIEFAESPENVARTAPDLADGVWVV